jgi:nitrate/TMAO reductase-like tetraheme cytochrome c subunit
MTRQDLLIAIVIAAMIAAVMLVFGVGQTPPAHANPARPDHLRATYSPLHFQPAIASASDEQCLACHREVLDDKVRATSPAGVQSATAKAWYQQLSVYAGDQETFHRRHLVTPLAQQLMKLKCNTCHEGHNPREEAQGSAADGPQQNDTGFTLRKQVNPETTCLKCHGQMDWQLMGLPGPWPQSKEQMGNSCLACHAAIRTSRHDVNYLDAQAIEAAGQANADACYGCHGGRAWYRIPYPYPRHAWPNMTPAPEKLKHRPAHSEPRFDKSASLNRFLQPTP